MSRDYKKLIKSVSEKDYNAFAEIFEELLGKEIIVGINEKVQQYLGEGKLNEEKAEIKIEDGGRYITVRIDGEEFDLGNHPSASKKEKTKLAKIKKYIDKADISDFEDDEWNTINF